LCALYFAERTTVFYRKHLIMGLLTLAGSKIGHNLKEIQEYEKASADEIKQKTDQKLGKLLLHAAENVPYYRNLLAECGVVKDGVVRLEYFSKIPLLTKSIIRQQGNKLHSRDHLSRRSYTNTSGGSTGEPVTFIQDKEYNDWNNATKIYYTEVLGKELGEPEIKFWGSDRDILKGTLSLKDKLINFLYNRRFFNSYELDEQHLQALIALNNRYKPKAYWSYMESALELGKYLSNHKAYFHSPDIVISTIGPLVAANKEQIEAGMGCKVYNQYGSREVGVVACQCKEQKGLHTFPWRNLVEVLDSKGNPKESGEGNIVVTTLDNFSMPLIRYDIGDVAVMGNNKCSCGRKTVVLDSVLGRTLGYFMKDDGMLVHSHFIVQALFFRPWIQRFKVIQEAINEIIILVELKPGVEAEPNDMRDITHKTQVLMGEQCRVDFRFTDKIERSASGKYVYTLCKIR
jgi:phenylacetate-CoA ligase